MLKSLSCCPFAAEADKRIVRTSWRLHSLFKQSNNPLSPFSLYDIHIPTRSSPSSGFKSVRPKADRVTFANKIRGRGAVPEGNHVRVHTHRVVRQVIKFTNGFDRHSEISRSVAGTTFFLEFLQSDLPELLCPTMFSGNFVNSSFDRLSQSEIIGMQSKHFVGFNRLEQPFG